MTYHLGDSLSVRVTPTTDGKTEFETSRDGEAISVVYLPETEADALRSKLEETTR
jgi:hypothetical protein